MLICALCMSAAALVLCRGRLRNRRLRPLDAGELRILRRFSDEWRREQIHPFE